jgi:hypothetical protein
VCAICSFHVVEGFLSPGKRHCTFFNISRSSTADGEHNFQRASQMAVVMPRGAEEPGFQAGTFGNSALTGGLRCAQFRGHHGGPCGFLHTFK